MLSNIKPKKALTSPAAAQWGLLRVTTIAVGTAVYYLWTRLGVGKRNPE